VLPPIEIHDIYQLDVYPVASKDHSKVWMPYIMRGLGGAATGAASYANELLTEIYEFDLQLNSVKMIQSRIPFQSIFKKAPHYMEAFKEGGHTTN
jgi:hypothetical protein